MVDAMTAREEHYKAHRWSRICRNVDVWLYRRTLRNFGAAMAIVGWSTVDRRLGDAYVRLLRDAHQ